MHTLMNHAKDISVIKQYPSILMQLDNLHMILIPLPLPIKFCFKDEKN